MTLAKHRECSECVNTTCIIRKHTNNPEIAEEINKKNTLNCKKSQHLILEGAPVHGLYFIKKGAIKVAKTGINGKEQIVRLGIAGEMIGHRGFASGQFYQISAVALENSTVCGFSNQTLQTIFQREPKFTYDMMLFYAEELNRSETKVKKFAQMSVREKVIDALLYINRKFGQRNGLLKLQLSRKEIADFAGTTEEQVIRTISSLKKEKLLNNSGKKIGIQNVDILSREISDHNFFIDS